jgi:hypothetical protein
VVADPALGNLVSYNQTTSASGAWWGWYDPWSYGYYGSYYGYWGYDDVQAWAGWNPGLSSVELASFTDPTNEPASAYTAVIAWGDSSTSTGLVIGSGGSYQVIGSHSYGTEGTYDFRVRPVHTCCPSEVVRVQGGISAPGCPPMATEWGLGSMEAFRQPPRWCDEPAPDQAAHPGRASAIWLATTG